MTVPTIIEPDASVRGSISSDDGNVKCRFNSAFKCIFGIPIGEIQGSFSIDNGTNNNIFVFSGIGAGIVSTLVRNAFTGAVIDRINVFDTSNERLIENCTFEVTAVRQNHNHWAGSLIIKTPEEMQLSLFGVFSGSIEVFRQITRKLPIV